MLQVNQLVDLAATIGADLAKDIVQATRVPFEYDWGKFDKASLLAVLGDMAENRHADYAAIDAKFSFIDDVRSNPKNKGFILDFLTQRNLMPEDPKKCQTIAKYRTTLKVAAYAASVLTEDLIALLLKQLSVNEKASCSWKHYELNIGSDIPQNVVADHEENLREILHDYIRNREKCAEYAESLVFRRGESQVFILKVDDRPEDVEVLKRELDGFETIALSRTLKLVVVLDGKNRRIRVLYRKGKKAREIAERFCKETLGGTDCRIVGEIVYDPSYFVKNAVTVIGGKEDGIVKRVKVVELYVNLAGKKDSRRTYFELERDIYETIRKELAPVMEPTILEMENRIFPIGTSARRVKLRVDYVYGNKNLHRTIELTPAAEDGLADAPREVRDELFCILSEKGIASRKEYKENGAVSVPSDSAGA